MRKIYILFFIIIVSTVFTAAAFAEQNKPDINKYEMPTYSKGANGEFIIKNKHLPEKKNITIIKEWFDDSNRDNKRPKTICVELLANGKVVDNHTVTGTGNTWNYTFTNKVIFNLGEPIDYKVQENGTSCNSLSVPNNSELCLLSGGAWNDNKCTMPSN